MTELEIDCLEYVTGAVARKFITKYPHLGKINDNDRNSSWIDHLSKGHLIIPSDELMLTAKIVDLVFKDYHTNKGLNNKPNVIINVVNRVINNMKNNIVPMEVIKCLVRTRTFLRINNMNKILFDKAKALRDKRCNVKKFNL